MRQRKTARWEMAWTNVVKVPGGKKTETVKPPSFSAFPTTTRPGPSSSLGGLARRKLWTPGAELD
jgi:hypothetical protein